MREIAYWLNDTVEAVLSAMMVWVIAAISIGATLCMIYWIRLDLSLSDPRVAFTAMLPLVDVSILAGAATAALRIVTVVFPPSNARVFTGTSTNPLEHSEISRTDVLNN